MAWGARTGMIAVAGLLAAACALSEFGEGNAGVEAVPEGGADEASPASSEDGSVSDSATGRGGTDDTGAGPTGDDASLPDDDAGSITDAPSRADTATDAAADAETFDATVSDANVFDAADAGPSDTGSDTGFRDAWSTDAGSADAGSTGIAVVQSGQANTSNTTTLSTTLSATTAGTFLAVMSSYAGVGPSIATVGDDAPGGSNAYVSANIRAVGGTCQASEIWYARDARPGVTSVTVTMTGMSTFLQVWVMEVSGLGATGGVDTSAVENDGPATTTITAPTVTPSAAHALIVASVGSCGEIGSIAPGNPFIALPVQVGNDAAYYITASEGAWGPVFNNAFDAWNASIAAFR